MANAAQKLNAQARKQAGNKLYSLGNYHENIPLAAISEALAAGGLVLIQEDGTAYEGIFCGREGDAKLMMAYKSSEYAGYNNIPTFVPIDNSRLILQWYKISTKYEINTYLS